MKHFPFLVPGISPAIQTRYTMEQTLIDQITCRLDRFEEALREIEKPDLTSTDASHGRASAPYLEYYRIRVLLDRYGDRGAEYQRAADEFNRLSGKLARLRKDRKEYRDELLAELRYFVGSCHAELCWQEAGKACPANRKCRPAREIVTILIEELRKDFDLRDIEELVESLDDACDRMKEIPERSAPQAPGPAPGELSLWRNNPGIKEE